MKYTIEKDPNIYYNGKISSISFNFIPENMLLTNFLGWIGKDYYFELINELKKKEMTLIFFEFYLEIKDNNITLIEFLSNRKMSINKREFLKLLNEWKKANRNIVNVSNFKMKRFWDRRCKIILPCESGFFRLDYYKEEWCRVYYISNKTMVFIGGIDIDSVKKSINKIADNNQKRFIFDEREFVYMISFTGPLRSSFITVEEPYLIKIIFERAAPFLLKNPEWTYDENNHSVLTAKFSKNNYEKLKMKIKKLCDKN